MRSFNAYQETHKSGRKSVYVEACWKVNGQQKHVSYSVRKHGWHGAAVKAITARETSQDRQLGIDADALAISLRQKFEGAQP